MPEQKRYPSSYTDFDAWTDPANLLGPEDGLCASKRATTLGLFEILVSSFGFSIPGDATNIRVYYGFNSFLAYGLYLLSTLRLRMIHGGAIEDWDTGGSGVSGSCADCVDNETLWTANTWTAADLNTENFTLTVQFDRYGGLIPTAYVDAVHIRVTYDVPAPPPAALGPVGDGLTWVQTARNNQYRERERKRERESIHPRSYLNRSRPVAGL